jgi:hypothetical protein
MNKKMNFFRFCRRSLAALPVFFLLISCDQLLPPGGNGEWVQVKIRAVNIAEGAQNKTNTRAGGDGSRIVGEPVIQDLGDGMLAEITVEEDLEALRTGDKSLIPNAWFRIIAIKSSDDTYLSHADFQAKTGNGYYTDDKLYVPSGVACDFVCFSFNGKFTTSGNNFFPALYNTGSTGCYWADGVSSTSGNPTCLYFTASTFASYRDRSPGNRYFIRCLYDPDWVRSVKVKRRPQRIALIKWAHGVAPFFFFYLFCRV